VGRCINIQSWCVLYTAPGTRVPSGINSNKLDYIVNGANLPTAFQGYPHPIFSLSRATRRVDKANFFTRDLYPTIVECNSIYIVPAQGHVSNSVRTSMKTGFHAVKTTGHAKNGQTMAQKPFLLPVTRVIGGLKNSNTAGEVEKRPAYYGLQSDPDCITAGQSVE